MLRFYRFRNPRVKSFFTRKRIERLNAYRRNTGHITSTCDLMPWTLKCRSSRTEQRSSFVFSRLIRPTYVRTCRVRTDFFVLSESILFLNSRIGNTPVTSPGGVVCHGTGGRRLFEKFEKIKTTDRSKLKLNGNNVRIIVAADVRKPNKTNVRYADRHFLSNIPKRFLVTVNGGQNLSFPPSTKDDGTLSLARTSDARDISTDPPVPGVFCPNSV